MQRTTQYRGWMLWCTAQISPFITKSLIPPAANSTKLCSYLGATSVKELPSPRFFPFLDAPCITGLTDHVGYKGLALLHQLWRTTPTPKRFFLCVCDPIAVQQPSDQSCCFYFSQVFFSRALLINFLHSNLACQNADSPSILLFGRDNWDIWICKTKQKIVSTK